MAETTETPSTILLLAQTSTSKCNCIKCNCPTSNQRISTRVFTVSNLHQRLTRKIGNGYRSAENFKIVLTSKHPSIKKTKALTKWCKSNGMKLSVKKVSILSLKGALDATLCATNVQKSSSQKYLGIMVSKNLTWTENSKQRFSKGFRSLFLIKRSLRIQMCNYKKL